ncbi:sigma-70 family RNA polymerase sigma factor [Streptomyces sp. NPDC021056]|uniref:sigma-70 family RNA polymerase sigma factor n=1 Tax=Streptomyces sp. NPDC021056 TaxID=3155012 RepID=UPI0033F88B81
MTDDSDGFNTLPASLEDLRALRGIRYEMPATLEAFYRRYARAQLDYAATILRDKEAAATVVRGLYHHLAMGWTVIQLEGCGPELYAWRTLKMLVEAHTRQTLADNPRQAALEARDRSLAIGQVARATLDAYRIRMADAQSSVGLYTALAALPDRQFDVMILHYELGYPTQHIADIMGLQPGTVRTHRRLAEERIAARLGIDLDADEERE